jgi:hypothetical protein
MTPRTDDQLKPACEGRLIRFVIAGWQRQADRRILMYLPNATHRQDFKAELERRLLGQ